MPVLTQQQAERVERNARAPQGYGVTREEARNSAQAYHASMNGKNFQLDTVPDQVKEWAREHPVRVFNVGPWPQRVLLGSLGQFTIPACPEGAPWIEMTKYDPHRGQLIPALDGLVFEPLKEDGRFSIRQHDGVQVADAILGIGSFQNPQNALTRFGCFKSKCGPGLPPFKEELEAASAALKQYLMSLVIDVRRAYADGKVGEVRGKDHYTAARLLKLSPAQEPWLKDIVVETDEVCPGCGSGYKKGIAVCRECRTILDEEKYKTLKRAS